MERNEAADADSLGLCGGRGLTRCGAMEEALTWAWRSGGGLHEAKRNESRRSGASPKARLLEWRNTKAGWALLLILPTGLLRGAADGIGCGGKRNRRFYCGWENGRPTRETRNFH